MNKNPELLRKAMANILENPLNHDQSSWIDKKFDEELLDRVDKVASAWERGEEFVY